ncbi:MAG: hypothetical protein ACI80V_003697 [Rhodothermales bacterium]|jgi:hypothetical protein
MSRTHRSDHGQLWEGVRHFNLSVGTDSRTSALRDSLEDLKGELSAATKSFSLLPEQVGFIALGPNGLVGIDLVSRPEVFAALFERLVQSYVADSMRLREPVVMEGQADAFLSGIQQAKAKPFPSPGLGTDLRFSPGTGTGTAPNHAGEIVHLVAFSTEAEGGSRDLSGNR